MLAELGRRVDTALRRGTDAAAEAAYATVQAIHLPGSHHRTDIATRALAGDVRVPVRA